MKKAIYSICAVLALGLASCGGSVDSNIEKLNNLAKEKKDLGNNKDITSREETVKGLQIDAEMYEIGAKLAKQDLTKDQIEKINNIEDCPISFSTSDYTSDDK